VIRFGWQQMERSKSRALQCTSRARIPTEQSCADICKVRRVEANIFEDVVVDTVIHDPETTSKQQLLVAG